MEYIQSGYKIPSILVIQNIFNQAWQLSTVKSYDKNDSDGFFKNIYNIYNLIMVFSCSAMIILTRFLARILYANDFYEAWKFVPFLMISIVFGALSGVLGGVFQAVKDSRILSTSTTVGALANIVFNIILIQCFGTLGAAIATAVAYCIVWIMRIKYVKKHMEIKIKITRDCIAYCFLVVQSMLMLIFKDTIVLYIIQFIIISTILMLYKNEIKDFLKKISKSVKKLVNSRNNK